MHLIEYLPLNEYGVDAARLANALVTEISPLLPSGWTYDVRQSDSLRPPKAATELAQLLTDEQLDEAFDRALISASA